MATNDDYYKYSYGGGSKIYIKKKCIERRDFEIAMHGKLLSDEWILKWFYFWLIGKIFNLLKII